MCFDGIFGDDPRVYCFQGGKLLDPKKVEAIVKMHAQEPSRHPSLQWLGLILPMFCELFSRHYGINHKIIEKIEGVHLDIRILRSMGNNQAQVSGGCNFNCSKLGEGI